MVALCQYRHLFYNLTAFLFNSVDVLGDFIPSVDVSLLCLHLFTTCAAENHSSALVIEKAWLKVFWREARQVCTIGCKMYLSMCAVAWYVLSVMWQESPVCPSSASLCWNCFQPWWFFLSLFLAAGLASLNFERRGMREIQNCSVKGSERTG